MPLIFVYGTLKRGFSNHRFLAGQTFVGEARTRPGFRLFDAGSYPGLVAWPADTEGVRGEVWSVDAEALTRLDRFEGLFEGLYRREPVPLLAPFDRSPVDAYVYARSIEGLREVGSNWTESS